MGHILAPRSTDRRIRDVAVPPSLRTLIIFVPQNPGMVNALGLFRGHVVEGGPLRPEEAQDQLAASVSIFNFA
jgi:hypothetical protein